MQDQPKNENTEFNGKNLFSFLYRTRFQIRKGDAVVVNLSILFSLISLLCAPWLVIGGIIAALILGYRFSMEKNAHGFSASAEDVFDNAKSNMKSAMQSFQEEFTSEREANTKNEEEK